MNKKILIIERKDASSPWGEEIKKLFSADGWSVEIVNSGLKGVERVQMSCPQVMIVIGETMDDCSSSALIQNVYHAPLEKMPKVITVVSAENYENFKVKSEKIINHDHSYFIKSTVSIKRLKELCESLLCEEKDIRKQFHDLFFETNKDESLINPETAKFPSGISSNESDVQTLKRYIDMKEKENNELQSHLNQAKDQLKLSTERMQLLEVESRQFLSEKRDMESKIKILSQELELLRKKFEDELQSKDHEHRSKSDRAILLERKLEQSEKLHEELKERVKKDIQNIRVKERELETKLELLKRDSETLLMAKDKKLLEFKRKLDAYEYEIEMLKEKQEISQKKGVVFKERSSRLLRLLKMGASLLENEELQDTAVSEETETITKKTSKVA